LFTATIEGTKHFPNHLTNVASHGVAGAVSGVYAAVALQPFSILNVVKKAALIGVAGAFFAHSEEQYRILYGSKSKSQKE
jgi:hypothetical protein